jgi:protein O-GlcNAc transferase
MTPAADPKLARAVKLHQGGQLAEAEQIYRDILAQRPGDPVVLHLLGLVFHQRGDNASAEQLIRQAIVFAPEAPDFHKNLARVLAASGKTQEAVDSYRAAARLRPEDGDAYLGVATLLSQMGRGDEAAAEYEKSLKIQPRRRDVWIGLAQLQVRKEDLEGARLIYERAMAQLPESAEILTNYGSVLLKLEDREGAIAAYRKASANLQSAVILMNLGGALAKAGQRGEAIEQFRKVVAMEPNSAVARGHLGGLLLEEGKREEALEQLQKAIEIQPVDADLRATLGRILSTLDRGDEAVEACRKAVALAPGSANIHHGLGLALRDLGKFDEAMAAFSRAQELDPKDPYIGSSLILTSLYHPGMDADSIRRLESDWDERYAQALRSAIVPHVNDRDADRRLRIGYVSADFSAHVVGRNVLPLIREHDRSQFEVFCYSNHAGPGVMTEKFKSYAEHWIEIGEMSDAAAARRIREDRIDVLIDLALHTVNHRLLVFARKPAPVQMTFAGYPGGTGLKTIDYRISDPYLDPGEGEEKSGSERVLRLADSFWCFDAEAMEVAHGYEVNELPALGAGYVTFGCLNVPFKMNEQVLELWAKVLGRVPNSRLLMLALQGEIRERILKKFAAWGIEASRIEFAGRRARAEYLRLFGRIDLGLDTFPYNSHSTGLESLWMGVPIVTLIGKTTVGRAGFSQLSNLGMREFVAATEEEFVEIAVKAAGDLPRLAEVRRNLRGRMAASPLCDAKRFARNVEAVLRTAWAGWGR